MKFAIPALASLALALAPAAHAQVSCAEIKEANAAGLNDFEDITGEEIDEDFYEASYMLAGADECTVDFAFDSVYSCLWVYDTLSAAATALNTQLSAIAPCLAGWSASAIDAEATATGGYRALLGSSFAGSGGYADMEWAVYLEEHTVDSVTDWHVSMGLAYLW